MSYRNFPRNFRAILPMRDDMCCTDALHLAPLLFVLALTGDPGLLDELVDALLDARPDAALLRFVGLREEVG